jgi:hypothetical protein
MDPILYWNDVALEANRVSDLVQMGQGTGAGHSLPAPLPDRGPARLP